MTDEEILKIDDLIEDWAMVALELGVTAHDKEEIPARYKDDEIFVEYYNGIRYGKTATEMRKVCLPKFIRKKMGDFDADKAWKWFGENIGNIANPSPFGTVIMLDRFDAYKEKFYNEMKN